MNHNSQKVHYYDLKGSETSPLLTNVHSVPNCKIQIIIIPVGSFAIAYSVFMVTHLLNVSGDQMVVLKMIFVRRNEYWVYPHWEISIVRWPHDMLVHDHKSVS